MLVIKKVTSFGQAAFNNSTVQPAYDINFPWSLDYIKKLAFMSPADNYYTILLPVLCAANIGAKEYQTYTGIALSGYQFTPWFSAASGP